MEFQKIAGTNTCSLIKGDDLSHVVIPNHYEGIPVVEIGDYAFTSFENLQSIILPETIQKLGIGAFGSCKKLVTIKIPNKVKKIPDWCFSNCNSLDSFNFHDGIETIGNNAFFHCGFVKIVIPKHVTIIEEEAFAYSPKLTEVVLPQNLTIIKTGGFSGCSQLRKVNLPHSLEVIEKDAFYLASDINIPYLPNDFVDIQDEAFDIEVDLPKKINPAFYTKNNSKNKEQKSDLGDESLIVSQTKTTTSKVFKSSVKVAKNLSTHEPSLEIQSEALDNLHDYLVRQKISNISVGEIYHSTFDEYSNGPYIFYYDAKKSLNFFRLPLIVDYNEKNIPYFKFHQNYFDTAISEKFIIDYKEIKSSASRLFVQSDETLADKTTKFFTKKHHEKPSSLTKTYFYEYVFLNDSRYKTLFAHWEECREKFLVPDAESYQGFSHLVKQHSMGSIQLMKEDDDLPMLGIINIISYSLVFNTLLMLNNEKNSKKRPLRNTSTNTPSELIENPFLWTKLSVEERSKLDDKVLYPDTESIENYDLGNDFYGLGGDHAADALSDFGSVSSSFTYEDAIAEDKDMLEMEMDPIYRRGLLLLVYLLNNEKPHPSMYKYFQKYCLPKLKSPKDHEKYLSDLEDNEEGRFMFLVYLIALHPKEIFDNELQLPNLFVDFPQD